MTAKTEIFVSQIADNGAVDYEGAIIQFGSHKSLVEFYSAADGYVFEERWIKNQDLQDPSKFRLFFNERDWMINTPVSLCNAGVIDEAKATMMVRRIDNQLLKEQSDGV